MKTRFIAVAVAATLSAAALAGQYNYAVWGSQSTNTVAGTVGGVGVTFSGPYDSVLTNYSGGYYDYNPSDYISSTVSNAPATTDNFIQLTGGNNFTYSVTFTQPVSNLVISVLSLGNTSDPTTFNFDKSFTLLSQGTDQWGGSNTSLSVSGNTLLGVEGSGSILFSGKTSTLTWTLPTAEGWYGFTVATPQATPEPASFAACAIGLVGLMLRRRRRV